MVSLGGYLSKFLKENPTIITQYSSPFSVKRVPWLPFPWLSFKASHNDFEAIFTFNKFAYDDRNKAKSNDFSKNTEAFYSM
jgi:hypothetical protein